MPGKVERGAMRRNSNETDNRYLWQTMVSRNCNETETRYPRRTEPKIALTGQIRSLSHVRIPHDLTAITINEK